MDAPIDAMAKLASELTDRVSELESENRSLSEELRQTKEAALSAAPVAAAAGPVVSEEVAKATTDALFKAGALTENQLDQSVRILMSDPEAPHRLLQHLIDAQTQTKAASAESEPDVSGGRLADGSQSLRKSAQEECEDRMMRILGMID